MGRPDLVALREADPVATPDNDFHYEGAGILDVIGRAAGLFGILGLLLLAPARRRTLA